MPPGPPRSPVARGPDGDGSGCDAPELTQNERPVTESVSCGGNADQVAEGDRRRPDDGKGAEAHLSPENGLVLNGEPADQEAETGDDRDRVEPRFAVERGDQGSQNDRDEHESDAQENVQPEQR